MIWNLKLRTSFLCINVLSYTSLLESQYVQQKFGLSKIGKVIENRNWKMSWFGILSWELLLCAWTYFRKPVCWKASETEIRTFCNLSTNNRKDMQLGLQGFVVIGWYINRKSEFLSHWLLDRLLYESTFVCNKKVLCFYQYSSLGAVTKIYIVCTIKIW